MGKTSNGYIDKIDAEIDKIAASIVHFQKLNPEYESHLKEKQDLTKKGDKNALNALETILKGIQTSLNKELTAAATAKAEALKLLKAFHTYVEDKDRTTKMPWNKKSVKSSREYITSTQQLVNNLDVPEKLTHDAKMDGSGLKSIKSKGATLKRETGTEPD